MLIDLLESDEPAILQRWMEHHLSAGSYRPDRISLADQPSGTAEALDAVLVVPPAVARLRHGRHLRRRLGCGPPRAGDALRLAGRAGLLSVGNRDVRVFSEGAVVRASPPAARERCGQARGRGLGNERHPRQAGVVYGV